MIQVSRLRYRTLDLDHLTLGPGITTLIGPNGSGKTTFLKLCAGILLPESGSILIDGTVPRETETGWVNETPDRNILFATVSDEIASPLRFRCTPCSRTVHRVRECAESVGISPLLSRAMADLSGGEKVLVSLAAALVFRPKVLVLDEYDSHLDAHTSEQVDAAIRRSGAAYVIRCTQQMDTASRSDQVLFFEKGAISRAGTPGTVFAALRSTPYYPPSWRYAACS